MVANNFRLKRSYRDEDGRLIDVWEKEDSGLEREKVLIDPNGGPEDEWVDEIEDMGTK